MTYKPYVSQIAINPNDALLTTIRHDIVIGHTDYGIVMYTISVAPRAAYDIHTEDEIYNSIRPEVPT